MIRTKLLPSTDDVEANMEEVPEIRNGTSSKETTNLCSITIESEDSVDMRKKSKGHIEVEGTFSEKLTMKNEFSEPFLYKSSVFIHDLAMAESVQSKGKYELPKTKKDICTSTEVSFPAGYYDDSMAMKSLAGNLNNSGATINDCQLESVQSKGNYERTKTQKKFFTSTEVSFAAGNDEDDSMAMKSLAGNLNNSGVTINDCQLESVQSKGNYELPKTKQDFCTSTEVSFPAGYDEDDSMAMESLAGNLKNSAAAIIDFQLETSFFGIRKD